MVVQDWGEVERSSRQRSWTRTGSPSQLFLSGLGLVWHIPKWDCTGGCRLESQLLVMRQRLGLSLDVLVALLACPSCPAVCCKHGAQAPQDPRQGGRAQQQEEFCLRLFLRSFSHRSQRPRRQQPGAAPCPRSRGVVWGVGGFPAGPPAAPQRLGQTRPASLPAPPSPALRTEQTLLRMAAWGLGVGVFRVPNLKPRWGCSRA